ncbi:SUF system NifU family Fe-S cluster assembly protein [Paraburkholderia sp. SARCC-3016]|uniref:Fe-S cluster assembly sulfur transfer protein SufU n=1 Tax=Paraburkholderia sp. SARCC-3016 TaxID=3058611 RepID=UPI002807F40E|nr:SUF system NifU family Fe-S cluster assembly protein [Paraburkholderia sp. SARCC-3016]MDQ7980591.1 SUF system NifU family Fe-S cluster assembly protein [Paraburkholderia sp. SARCC-3016]
MSDIRELYQEVIFDHYRRPHNRHEVAHASHTAVGYNALCGDRVELALRVANGIVIEVGFDGEGCAIATASASMMTDLVKGKTLEEAQRLIERFQAMVTSDREPAQRDTEGLGKTRVLAGVREYPARVKCATLAWHTLSAALQGRKEHEE